MILPDAENAARFRAFGRSRRTLNLTLRIALSPGLPLAVGFVVKCASTCCNHQTVLVIAFLAILSQVYSGS